jgi:hypothetical protein
MKARKIEYSDIKDIRISSLPTRPTAPRALGGMGYGASEMKEAFDRLPLYVIERYNELIESVGELGEESLAASMPTGIRDGHTVFDLCEDVRSGALAGYLSFLGMPLTKHIGELYERLDEMKKRLDALEKGVAKE